MRRLRAAAICVLLALAPLACGRVEHSGAGANPPQVEDAELLSATIGWVRTEDALALTFDGGKTWRGVLAPASGPYVARFWTPTAGASVELTRRGDPTAPQVITVRLTGDGGRSWHPAAAIIGPSSDQLIPAVIDFLDARHGWVLATALTSSAFSRAYLYQTTDGGISWTSHPTPSSGAVKFATQSEGWLIGGAGPPHVYQTHDGGLTWRESGLPPYEGIRLRRLGLPFAVGGGSWLLGRATDSAAEILRSTDDGASWQRAARVTGTGQPTISLVDGSNWFVAFDDQVIATGNGGDTWDQRSTLPNAGTLQFRTQRVGWALESHGECRSFKSDCHRVAKLMATTDGGRSWTQLQPP